MRRNRLVDREIKPLAATVIVAEPEGPMEESGEEAIRHLPKSVEVFDRSRLILEIFALRAESRYAQLQVSLARTLYLRTKIFPGTPQRLKQIHEFLSVMTGSLNGIKSWKDSVVTDIVSSDTLAVHDWEKRTIEEGTCRLRDLLRRAEVARKTQRSRRSTLPTIALVGYTNAGKTALMNYLTDSELVERDLLFQTLETTARRLRMPDGSQALIIDSIGFIQDLPLMLYDAFKSTFEELYNADVILHVRDLSNPQTEMQRQTVIHTLLDAGMDESKLDCNMIEVCNKIDLLSQEQLNELMNFLGDGAVPICAKDGTGIDVLMTLMEEILLRERTEENLTVRFPITKSAECLKYWETLQCMDQECLVVSEDGRHMWVKVTASLGDLQRFCANFRIKPSEACIPIPEELLEKQKQHKTH
eukprot:Platyproteum_vivax@DN4767_c0_g1_i2.p1